MLGKLSFFFKNTKILIFEHIPLTLSLPTGCNLTLSLPIRCNLSLPIFSQKRKFSQNLKASYLSEHDFKYTYLTVMSFRDQITFENALESSESILSDKII